MAKGGFATRGLGEAEGVPQSSRQRFEKEFYLREGDEADIVLLDDESFNVYRHSLFLKGDSKAAKIKCTCPDSSPDGDPKGCRVCNAMIHDDSRIGRYWVGYLTIIDLRETEWKGQKWTHTKKLLPLDRKTAMKLAKKKQKNGSLVGAKFHLYRTDKNASRVGDDWEMTAKLDLKKFFGKSPRIKGLVEGAKRKGETLTDADALAMLTTPYDYEEVLDPDPKKAAFLLAYLGVDDGVKKEDGEQTVDYSGEEEFTGDADKEEVKEEDDENADIQKPKTGFKKPVKK